MTFLVPVAITTTMVDGCLARAIVPEPGSRATQLGYLLGGFQQARAAQARPFPTDRSVATGDVESSG